MKPIEVPDPVPLPFLSLPYLSERVTNEYTTLVEVMNNLNAPRSLHDAVINLGNSIRSLSNAITATSKSSSER